MLSFADIEQARTRIKDHIYLSPFPYSETVSRLTGSRVFFKLENLQMTGSFKERGALNRLLTLSSEEGSRGVIAASAGNHGMAVAFHSQRLGIAATIVMPRHAPLIKVRRVRQYGGTALLFGSDYEEAFAEARRLSAQTGAVYISAFDDPLIVAGQGTIGLEIHEQNPDIQTLLVPVGGGGLIAGVALALKTLNPRIRIIGVQAEALPSMKEALVKGEPVRLPPALTIADGIAVRRVGETPLALVKQYVDEIVTVSEGQIANAVLQLLEIEKTVAEGAAAVALAPLLEETLSLRGNNVGVIISGGNIDMNLISRIIEKGLIEDGRLGRVLVVVSDRPGNLARLAQRIADHGANILQIDQTRGFGQAAIGETEVELVLETSGRQQIEEICTALTREGFRVRDGS